MKRIVMNIVGWLLNISDWSHVDRIEGPVLVSPLLQQRSSWFWLLLAFLALAGVVYAYYFLSKTRAAWGKRLLMATLRLAALVLLLLTVFDPRLRLVRSRTYRPKVLVVFDDTQSMTAADNVNRARAERLAVKYHLSSLAEVESRTRLEWLKALIRGGSNREGSQSIMARLQQRKDCDLEFFRISADGVEPLAPEHTSTANDATIDLPDLAARLTGAARPTDLNAALRKLAALRRGAPVAAVIMFSDFAHNTGDSPIARSTGGVSAAELLAAPISTIGLGEAASRDISVQLLSDARWKRGEETFVVAKVRQQGFEGQSIRLTIRGEERVTGDSGGNVNSNQGSSIRLRIGEKNVSLNGAETYVEFPFTPRVAGAFSIIAETEVLAGEQQRENNRVSQKITIVDDYLRLLYLAEQPSWEWRFVKEVFHRDVLVGVDGFRTFLDTSSPRVREENSFFLPAFPPARRDFFNADVIFLGEMPPTRLDDRFLDMLREYVGVFGGGLVVIAGPRHGAAGLKPLADLLPVVLNDDPPVFDVKEFTPRLTAEAERYPFMRLHENETENRKAWQALRRLSWRQPVAQLHERADALLEHPEKTCADGVTPQPLIAIRRYGNGEVVFMASDEMWRLRRLHGDKFYRKFWSQLIYRLGMSHPLGAGKRFVLSADRRRYRSGEQAVLRIDAYDLEYRPLRAEEWPSLEVALFAAGETTASFKAIPVAEGRYEAPTPLAAAGEYVARVQDPLAEQVHEVRFDVVESDIEMRRLARDARLQKAIAAQTGGKSYDLLTVDNIVNDLTISPQKETQTRMHRLWSTPLWFMLVVGALFSEWTLRKLSHLK